MFRNLKIARALKNRIDLAMIASGLPELL